MVGLSSAAGPVLVAEVQGFGEDLLTLIIQDQVLHARLIRNAVAQGEALGFYVRIIHPQVNRAVVVEVHAEGLLEEYLLLLSEHHEFEITIPAEVPRRLAVAQNDVFLDHGEIGVDPQHEFEDAAVQLHDRWCALEIG